MIYIVFGVSGSGKSTIGQELASRLSIPFYDGDDFHSQSNIDKMTNGQPLNDEDRLPWLEDVADQFEPWSENGGAVLACSALKHSYRELFARTGVPLQWIWLKGDFQIIEERLKTRRDHYFSPDMLQSQFDALEIPEIGWSFEVSASPEVIINSIINAIEMNQGKSDIGVMGLGVMGRNLALNIAENSFSVSAYNRHLKDIEEDVAKKFVDENSNFNNISPFDDISAFVQSLARPRKILVMIKAGHATEALMHALKEHLEPGDILIDGGNSHYRKTEAMQHVLAKLGIQYIGLGVSGGATGARRGPSLMPGGEARAIAQVMPVLNAIAARDKSGRACCTHIGPGGAGHYVKMIHNGIEYAEMQLIADCYQLLLHNAANSAEQIRGIFEEWNEVALASYLLEATIAVLAEKENDIALVDLISDRASHQGTGRWTVESALEHGISSDTIFSSLSARQISSISSIRELMSQQQVNRPPMRPVDEAPLRKAYTASRIINHAIGFQLLRTASTEYGWNLNLSEIARIWTNGCIIRSALVEQLSVGIADFEPHILLHPELAKEVGATEQSLKSIVAEGLKAGVSIPALTAALSYYNNLTTRRMSTNVVQAQRNYFGAHGFQRDDDPSGGVHHGPWHN